MGGRKENDELSNQLTTEQVLIQNGFQLSGIAQNEYDIEINERVSLCVWFENGAISQVYFDNFDAGIECQLPIMDVLKVVEIKNALKARAENRLSLHIHSLKESED